MKKVVLSILTPLALMFSFVNPAHAVCDQARLHVARSEVVGNGPHIFDLGPAVVSPTFYYRFTTTNPQIIDDLNSAWVGHFTVRIIGNAPTCGTTGVIRSGGVIQTLFRDSFF
jgi:hypothetical protein